jgi:hypothetical protein
MARGDYATAEALAAKGRELQQFDAEVEALSKRWRELRRGGSSAKRKNTTTALWTYYQPILKALAEAGGQARRPEIEPLVERIMAGTFQTGDREPLGHDTVRWQVMIRRARKHLVAEGWIADESGPLWKITESGRRTAEKTIPKDAGTRK